MNAKDDSQDKYGQDFLDELSRGQHYLDELRQESNQDKMPKKDLHRILISYQILIEEIVCWSSHQEYNLIVQKFLDKEMDGLQFQDALLKLWYSDMKQVEQLIETIEAGNRNQLPDLVYSSKSSIFSSVINGLFFTVEDIQSVDESTIRSFIEESYFPSFRNHFDD